MFGTEHQSTDSPQLPERQEEGKEVDTTVREIYEAWDKVVGNPDSLTNLADRKAEFGEKPIAFVAGGALPTRFGVEESYIWQQIKKNIDPKTQTIAIAEVEFSLPDLQLLGDFYRYLHDEKNFSLHCIDERLKDDVANQHAEVHDKCGACAAVAKAAGIEGNLEEILMAEVGQEVKQGVYDDMPHHESISILVDYHGADVALDDVRDSLKRVKALPFNASMPLPMIEAWAIEKHGDAEALLAVLAKWNVQIARNIIGDHHNTLHSHQAETQIIADQRGVGEHPLLSAAHSAVSQVRHGRSVVIAA